MSTKREPGITRRSFCNRALLTSAAVIVAGSDVTGQKDQQNLAAYPPVRIDGAERVMPGSYLYFNYPKANNPAVLLRTSDGQFLAYSRKCAHLGCSVDYDTSARCLTCPCHRGIYDSRNGYVMVGPPPKPLDQIILQVRAGGEVWAVGKRPGGDFNA